MANGNLYFIKDDFYEKFKSADNKPNKKRDATGEHNRPCYYAFKENDIFWMIPVSSQYAKYEKLYKQKTKDGKDCDTIVLGYVKGNKNAFLIQNMIPVTSKYINNLYVYKDTNKPVTINKRTQKLINAKARKVLRFARNNMKLTYTPIMEIEEKLLEVLTEGNTIKQTAAAKE